MAVPETTTESTHAADARWEDAPPNRAARVHVRPHAARDLLRSTPARLLAVGVALLLGTVAAGLIASMVAGERKQDIDTLLSTTEPLARSSQNLYASLSVADAAAATAFLSGGVEPSEDRDRYSQAIGTAAAELVATSDGLPGDDQGRRLLTEIATKLPVYTGLVETARTNNRAGNPVGTAYLAEASALMQTDLLPLAQALHTERAAASLAPQSGFARPPWFAIGLLVALLAALVATQVVLSRRTRRTFNAGLLLTTTAMAALLVWMLVAGIISAVSAHEAVRQGSEPLSTFAAARILAQQARTQEILQLVRRDEKAEHAQVFVDDTDQLRNLLDNYSVDVGRDDADRAVQALDGWTASHQRMIDALTVGDWTAAAMTTVGSDPATAASQFDIVDAALSDGTEAARAELRGDISRSSTVLSALGPGALVLTVVAAIGIPVGLWPRLREYQ
ncbi:hypothetical protein [Rhodococcus sp. W8901]|uniref:hypothetical protein n=1 Tax=Rhodococcus sp. W8901 TaxID=2742603 RepID=UPI0015817556|nr:hypothetical protein [Rhodococcus sp. W8901]QKT13080.1 hypothetical protein HUN07_22255 [Rhodococcus sp. W8901]